MGATSIHPSQRRFSCEPCRKHKSRCTRMQENAAKCTRCMVLGAECTIGQQGKVGRPKRAAVSALGAPKKPGLKSRPSIKTSPSKIFEPQSQLNSYGKSQETPSFLEVYDRPGVSRIVSPAAMPIPAPSRVTAADDAFFLAPTRSTAGMPSFYHDSLTGNVGHTFDRDFLLPDFDSTLDFTNTGVHLLDPAAISINCAPDTLTILGRVNAAGDIDNSDAISKLSKINIDLHIRITATERNKAILDLNSILYRESPLFIHNYTLAEFMLNTSEEFLQILKRLCSSQNPFPLPLQSPIGNRHNPTSTFSLTYPFAAAQPLLAPLSLTITSIFSQLISLYELLLEHLTARIARLAIDPIATIPGITFGGLPLENPCIQGLLFCNLTVHRLEGMERALGISETPEGIDVLWSELDERIGITPCSGAMRPARVKRLLGKVAIIFKKLSLST
ncbi:Zn(II)2Cys6 transcription factor domain-containing protein [Aspergillus novofumigatus IBT 16806]|uniref:C6 zinc finger domain protein n=1 Tax=Aspergillus novofumigatus (strain IBT 16806) TaxID=1392255 RepID=A0A2I1BSF4_ASPN1|nr:C6 zinc finger domain protein [Aspergillus novofumigatus IBT 16806]PKX88337.1 C6 zinc finger domain protein [Aspergillus novofumigatus IBT 16806]